MAIQMSTHKTGFEHPQPWQGDFNEHPQHGFS